MIFIVCDLLRGIDTYFCLVAKLNHFEISKLELLRPS
jgi:hypothetical protein